MSTELIERKLNELTRRVERLETKERPVAKPAWREAFGAMKDDPLLREAARLGAQWRARENVRE